MLFKYSGLAKSTVIFEKARSSDTLNMGNDGEFGVVYAFPIILLQMQHFANSVFTT